MRRPSMDDTFEKVETKGRGKDDKPKDENKSLGMDEIEIDGISSITANTANLIHPEPYIPLSQTSISYTVEPQDDHNLINDSRPVSPNVAQNRVMSFIDRMAGIFDDDTPLRIPTPENNNVDISFSDPGRNFVLEYESVYGEGSYENDLYFEPGGHEALMRKFDEREKIKATFEEDPNKKLKKTMEKVYSEVMFGASRPDTFAKVLSIVKDLQGDVTGLQEARREQNMDDFMREVFPEKFQDTGFFGTKEEEAHRMLEARKWLASILTGDDEVGGPVNLDNLKFFISRLEQILDDSSTASRVGVTAMYRARDAVEKLKRFSEIQSLYREGNDTPFLPPSIYALSDPVVQSIYDFWTDFSLNHARDLCFDDISVNQGSSVGELSFHTADADAEIPNATQKPKGPDPKKGQKKKEEKGHPKRRDNVEGESAAFAACMALLKAVQACLCYSPGMTALVLLGIAALLVTYIVLSELKYYRFR